MLVREVNSKGIFVLRSSTFIACDNKTVSDASRKTPPPSPHFHRAIVRSDSRHRIVSGADVRRLCHCFLGASD